MVCCIWQSYTAYASLLPARYGKEPQGGNLVAYASRVLLMRIHSQRFLSDASVSVVSFLCVCSCVSFWGRKERLLLRKSEVLRGVHTGSNFEPFGNSLSLVVYTMLLFSQSGMFCV
ncbi:MAG: hypothetical protein CL920_21260 [Deltaproteobacteria bacterium]|nr:hypothetical protein [Deltaproteobacteria bacterium]MBU51225.1 hypothetical protein [Deltaproteobacteria bacterium]